METLPSPDTAAWYWPPRERPVRSPKTAATVWTSDIKRAMRLTKAIRAGTVGINGYQLEPHAAFGGYGQSGLGREGGRPAIESYTELKTVLLPFTDQMM
jgi:aldehyde dehydrogenase (NAD+)